MEQSLSISQDQAASFYYLNNNEVPELGPYEFPLLNNPIQFDIVGYDSDFKMVKVCTSQDEMFMEMEFHENKLIEKSIPIKIGSKVKVAM
jgi:hypothetical protein